jgi:FtsH-binding integral membrane protein
MRVRNGILAVFLLSEAVVVTMGALAYSEGRSYPGNGATLGVIILMLPLLFERAGWFKMPLFMYIWASLAVGLHTFGLVWGLYDSTWWWDELTHATSSSMVCMIAALGLYLFDMHSVKIKVPRWAYPMMILTFSIFIGTVWEIAELSGALLTGRGIQYSTKDTLRDSYLDLLGGSFTSLLWVSWLWRDTKGVLGSSVQKPLIDRLNRAFYSRR